MPKSKTTKAKKPAVKKPAPKKKAVTKEKSGPFYLILLTDTKGTAISNYIVESDGPHKDPKFEAIIEAAKAKNLYIDCVLCDVQRLETAIGRLAEDIHEAELEDDEPDEVDNGSIDIVVDDDDDEDEPEEKWPGMFAEDD